MDVSFKISFDSTNMIREAKEWIYINDFENKEDFDDCLSEWVAGNIGRFVSFEGVKND